MTMTAPAWLSAEADVAFRLSCGCRHAAEGRSRVVELRNVGSSFPCHRHGDVTIVEATFKLVDGARELDRVRLGGRNYLRPTDTVNVLPSRPGKRDGYVATVRRIVEVAEDVVEVEVYGAPGAKAPSIRTYPLSRLARRAQTRTERSPA